MSETHEISTPARAQAAVARFAPAVGFGLRVAALAGLVVTGGVGVADLAGAFDGPAGMASIWPTASTCCSEDQN